MAAPTVVGTSVPYESLSSDLTITASLTVPASATKVVACFGTFDGGQVNTVSAITFDGVAMTLLDEEWNTGSDNGAWQYEIDAPSTGTFTLSITFANTSGAFQKRGTVFSLTDCTGFGATNAVAQSSVTTFSAGALTSTTDDLAIGAVLLFPGPRTIGGDDTEIDNVGASNARLYAFTTAGGSPTTTVDTDCTSSSGAIVGVIAQGTGGAGPTGIPLFRRRMEGY